MELFRSAHPLVLDCFLGFFVVLLFIGGGVIVCSFFFTAIVDLLLRRFGILCFHFGLMYLET